MSDSISAEQDRKHNIEFMGEELGKLYSALWQQQTLLHRKWGHYVALFGTSEERIDILNKVAPGFFHDVQTALWEDALLHLSRVTDFSSTAGNANLTFRRLPQSIDREPLRQQVKDQLDAAIEATKFARDWRNRRIAHRDLSLVLGQQTEPLKLASRAGFDDALCLLDSVLNLVSLSYLNSTTMFKFAQEPNAGGATCMLEYLRAGYSVEQERLTRIRTRSFFEFDLDRGSI